MKEQFTEHLLRDLVQQIDRFEKVDPESEYRLLGMRSRIAGPFIRETKKGAETSADKLNRVETGDFIYSRLFAWQGSFGLIPEEMDGCYVSNEFPIFNLDTNRIIPEYLVYWFALPHIQKRVEIDCSGSTPGTRNRYKEQFFLNLRIPLPSIDEQLLVVSKIRSLTVKISEAKQLRQEILNDTTALLVAMAHRNDLSDQDKEKWGWKKTRLADVLTQAQDPVDVEAGKEYPHFGIYSFAKGLFKKPPLLGDEVKATKLYRVHQGQFIYARLNAYEGAFSVVTEEFEKHYLSNEFPTFSCDESRVLGEFLAAYFLSPKIWEDLKRNVTGIGGGAGNRRIRLKESVFLSMPIWLPPIQWQEKIKAATIKIQVIRTEQHSADSELDALLPAILDKAFKGELV